MTPYGDERAWKGPRKYMQIVVSDKKRVESLGGLDTGYSNEKERRKGKEDV